MNEILKKWAPAIFAIVVIIGYDKFFRDKANPEIEHPLTVAARQYVRSLPKAYSAARDAVQTGTAKSKKDVVSIASQGAAVPFASALDQAFASAINAETGDITNVALAISILNDAIEGFK